MPKDICVSSLWLCYKMYLSGQGSLLLPLNPEAVLVYFSVSSISFHKLAEAVSILRMLNVLNFNSLCKDWALTCLSTTSSRMCCISFGMILPHIPCQIEPRFLVYSHVSIQKMSLWKRLEEIQSNSLFISYELFYWIIEV